MMFLVVLIVATAVTAAVRPRSGLRTHARLGLGTAMVFAGAGHLLQPTPFEQHVPDFIPGAGLIVLVSGLVEITLGILLLTVRRHRRAVGQALAAFLVAVFPANVYVAVAGVDVHGQPGGPYPWIRLPFQALFVAWALWSTRPPAPTASEPAPEAGDVADISHGGALLPAGASGSQS